MGSRAVGNVSLDRHAIDNDKMMCSWDFDRTSKKWHTVAYEFLLTGKKGAERPTCETIFEKPATALAD